MFVILFLCLLFGSSQCFGEASYVVNFESPIYVTAGEEYLDCSRVVCERYNDSTAVMYGEIEFLKNMEPGLILYVILKKEASGKHEVLFSHDICDLCKELGDGDSNYKNYLKYIGMPQSCPFDAGVFEIRNLIVDLDDFEIKDQQCGAYLAELYLYKSTGESCKNDRELLVVMKLDLSIERNG